ncbi:MAG: type II/IV secretion system protein [Candidatus Omnitrophica bacterium]|nr:type II/IV secretion system protein [Candidatus Omnitrophota bacterium]
MRIGEALLSQGLIKPDQLEIAVEQQHKSKERLGDIIIKMGFVAPEQMAPFIAGHFNLPFFNIKNIYKEIPPEVISCVPEDLARRFTVLPVSLSEDILTLAMFDPLDIVAEDAIRIKTGFRIKRMVAYEHDITGAIEYCYSQLPKLQEHVENFIGQDAPQHQGEVVDKLRLEASDPPVVKYVHQLVVQAFNNDSSDIHIQPKQDKVELRLRIDSILSDFPAPPKSMLPAITTRIKILSGLDIAERRLPQDGRFKMLIGNQEIDVRVSCFPTIYGESIVMRLLNTSSPLTGLDKIGFSPIDLEKYRKIIRRPYGIILVTGPTGSGKTTTLYTTLSEIHSPEKNTVTLEDPVEYRLEFIQQTQINPVIGFNFARGLRSILRQDPDIIMIGEIRDKETAEIAIHAALTGHLVFATLHTNDAAGAPVRLINMGVEPFLLSSSLVGVLAQRLVRCICPECKEEQVVTKKVLERLGINDDRMTLFHGKGCPKCMNRGYKGRSAIFETMMVNDDIRNLINARNSSEEIARKAITCGMQTLSDSGIEKMKAGITTIDEVLRVTREFQEL